MNSKQRRKARRQFAPYYRKLPMSIFNDAKYFIARCTVSAEWLRMPPEEQIKHIYDKPKL